MTKGTAMTLRLRTTVLPSTPTELPSIRVEKSRLVKASTGVWFLTEGEFGTATIPPDFYMERRELATLGKDPAIEDLEQFVQQWGLFADTRYRDIQDDESEQVALALENETLAEKYRGQESFRQAKLDTLFELEMLTESEARPKGFAGVVEAFPAWDALEKRGVRLVNASELLHRLFLLSTFVEMYENIDATEVKYLADMKEDYARFNTALSVFAVRLVIEDFADHDQKPTLFNAVALQIVNDILLDVPKHKCANENCGRMFTRQRGRAQYGEYRMKEVMYCDSRCARAQASRNLRRRRATKGETNNV